MNIYVASVYWLQWTLGYLYLFELWFSQGICLVVELLSHTLALFLIFFHRLFLKLPCHQIICPKIFNIWGQNSEQKKFCNVLRQLLWGNLHACSVMSDSLWLRELQNTRFPSLSPRICSNSYPLSRWCHSTISFSVTCFSSCPQSFPASRSSN